jgi:hypothetical protein
MNANKFHATCERINRSGGVSIQLPNDSSFVGMTTIHELGWTLSTGTRFEENGHNASSPQHIAGHVQQDEWGGVRIVRDNAVDTVASGQAVEGLIGEDPLASDGTQIQSIFNGNVVNLKRFAANPTECR